ncbi:MAG: hypothetical protein HF314_03405 [Ignavibacteria bacterium]|nr:hypothetical protein [Ignavibacteria bacterium]MCU7502097.1 hypothetical protein [Ignavibacteria bacterium]MCU7515499.1 hypothetical protein [Ignavibacteria bacterium]
MKSFYRFAVLAFFSLIFLTSGNVFADTDFFSVYCARHANAYAYLDAPVELYHTVTYTEWFMAGGASEGVEFHLSATYDEYPNVVYPWGLEVYVNGVSVINTTFSQNSNLDQNIHVHAGDVIRVIVTPSDCFMIDAQKAAATNGALVPGIIASTTVHFGL